VVPASEAPYRELLGAPVRFAAPVSAIAIDPAELAAPLPPRDPALHEMLTRFAEERLARVAVRRELADEVRLAVRRAFDGNRAPEVSAIARHLGMGQRTLGRRLQEQGTTYAALLDDVRRVTALELLERDVTTAEIAFFLGYSDSRAFLRAFRRWTGLTPGRFRRSTL